MQYRIESLMRRRKQHDKNINNLLNNITAQSLNICQQYPEFTKISDPETFRSNVSKFSNLSRQVNLLANLEFENSQPPKQIVSRKGALYDSILKHFGNDIQICLISEIKNDTGIVLTEKQVDFQVLMQYFDENQLWEDVFIQEQQDFYVTLFGNKYQQEVQLLSDKQLHPQELALLSSFSNKINIGYLLMYRTLSILKTGFAPEVLQKILGYPYHSFDLLKTSDYLNFIDCIQKKEKQADWLLLGRKKSDRKLQKINHQKEKTSFKDFPLKYTEISIVEVEDLNARHMPLVHQRNHHLVIDFQNKEQGKYYFSLNSFRQNSNYEYRICLLNQNAQIVHHQILSNYQCCQLELEVSQYKIYVSQLHNEETLCKFNFVVQSKLNLSEAEVSLKFVEEYNFFTRTLINKYIQSISLDPVEKEIESLIQIDEDYDVIIVRVLLNFMGLCVDFLSFNPEKIEEGRRVKVEYEDMESLCDLEYRERMKKIQIGQAWIVQIYLSKASRIRSISGLKYVYSELFL